MTNRFNPRPALVFLAALLSLTLLAHAAAPASARDAALLYVNAGETLTDVQTIQAAGGPYYFVIISNVPSVLLKAEGEGFAAVTDAGTLASAIRAYLTVGFNATPYTPAFVTAVQANRSVVNASVTDCIAGIRVMEDHRTSVALRTMRNGRSTYYPSEWGYFCHVVPEEILCGEDKDFCHGSGLSPGQQAACTKWDLGSRAVSTDQLEAKLGAVNKGVADLAVGVDAKDVDKIGTSLTSAGAAAADLKADYAIVSTNANKLVTSFPYLLNEGSLTHNCSSGANYTNAINALAALKAQNQYYTVDALSSTISTQTGTRGTLAQSGQAYAARKGKLDKAVSEQVAVSGKYAGIDVTLSFLATAASTAKAKLDAVKTANATQLNATLASYDNAYSALVDKTAAYAALFSEYNATASLAAQSRLAVSKKREQFGPNDERLNALAANQTATQSRFEAKKQLVLSGSPPSVADLQALSTEFTRIQNEATALQPKENQLDPVLIGGAAIVLALLVAIVYVLRKRKKGEGGQPVALGPP